MSSSRRRSPAPWSVGCIALMAVGLSLTWGMLRVINLAHFGLILLGAYLTFELATTCRASTRC